jgi:hypothetical protein
MKRWESRIADCGLAKAGALALLAGAMFFAPGCAKRQSTMAKPPQINPPPPVEADAGVRVNELEELSRRFEQTVAKLPGSTPDEHRQAVQQVFAELAQVLPVLYGPNPPGTFRQQLRVVESSRTQLAAASKGLAVAPTIDTGLRAARDALASLATASYFDQAQLGQAMDRLTSTLNDLDTARGGMHQGVVAEAATQMSQVIRQMAQTLSQRLDDTRPENGTPARGQAPPPEPAPAPAPESAAPQAAPDQAQ